MVQRKPQKDLEMNCAACGTNQNVDRAHIRTRGAGAGWEEWEWVPLCRKHHVQQGAVGWHRFACENPKVGMALAERSWTFENRFGVMKLVRLPID